MLCVVVLLPAAALAQRRLVIVDEDALEPADSGEIAMLALLQSPGAQVLGITIVTGDGWRDEAVQRTLRMLELTHHADVPLAAGAVFPLVRTQDETMLAAQSYGRPVWLGAWGGTTGKPDHGPSDVPPLPEGTPALKPIDEDAAHFLVRQVRAHPGDITIYAAGPLTNIALAIAIEPRFAEMTKGIVIMGSSLNPQTDDPEFANSPRSEFNFWFDPEAAHNVLRARWPRIDVTTVDVSLKTKLTDDLVAELSRSSASAAQYVAKYSKSRDYQWDEIAALAWLDPSLITKTRDVYMDVDVSHGASYGHTLTWDEAHRPSRDLPLVHAQLDLDVSRFRKLFVELMTRGAPAR